MNRSPFTPAEIPGAVCAMAILLSPAIANGQAAFAGQYIGQVRIEYSGTLTSGPSSAGLTSFTVRADGTVAEAGNDLIGTVDSGGTITWQTPNPFNFTTGTISGEILSSSGSATANGLTITTSVDVPKAGLRFPPGESFGGQLTDLNPANGFVSMNALAPAGDGFVAAGSLILSDGGINWRRSAAPTTKTLNAVAFGNGLYITGGNTGLFFTSTDAVEWTMRSSPISNRFADIDEMAFGNGVFVVTSGLRSGSRSTDGINWSISNSAYNSSLIATAYANGRFIGVGSELVESTDGKTWSKSERNKLAISAVDFQIGTRGAIDFFGEKVVLTGSDSVSSSMSLNTRIGSITGPQYFAGDEPFTSESIDSLTHNGTTFVGVGGNRIIVSTDSGATFTTPGTAGASGLESETWGGGSFVAVGQKWTEKFSGIGGYFFTDSLVANGLIVLASDQGIVGIAVEDNFPYVTGKPQPTTLNAGTPLSLSVTVSGTNPLTYQWFQNGMPLANGGSVSGANGATLTINNISPGFSGTYQVTVTNPDGSRTSKEAVVTVEGSAVVGFDAWKAGFTFPPGEDGPLEDPDGDGVRNLLEFVSGSNPVTSGPAFLPSSGALSGSQIGGAADVSKNYLTFQARVRKDRLGITLVPQSGNTLADFTNANVAQAGVPVDDPFDPGFELITYYHTVAIEDSPTGKEFKRLSVSL